MIPLFDKDLQLVGWMRPGQHIWDSDLEWLAYIRNGHAWSQKDRKWIGPVGEGTCIDRDGHVVAWSPGAPLQGAPPSERPPHVPGRPRPARPVSPARPARPVQPAPPPEGWSSLSFEQWIALGLDGS